LQRAETVATPALSQRKEFPANAAKSSGLSATIRASKLRAENGTATSIAKASLRRTRQDSIDSTAHAGGAEKSPNRDQQLSQKVSFGSRFQPKWNGVAWPSEEGGPLQEEFESRWKSKFSKRGSKAVTNNLVVNSRINIRCFCSYHVFLLVYDKSQRLSKQPLNLDSQTINIR
jgi:hypothetical protein